jgi:peptidoglycan/xylan/chitin deacetylase (PgdA/CDA1 family)
VDHVVEHFRTVRFRELPAECNGGSRRTASCFTFDDGYRDNVEVALPILEERGVLATFFLVPTLFGATFPGRSNHRVMELGLARELVARGHEIGAHSLTHRRLTRLSEIEARREIEASRRELEDELCVAVTSFAYPKGDHDEGVRAMVAASGFRVAATVREGLVSSEPDWLAIPRVSVRPSESMLAFRCKLHPSIDLYERLVRRGCPVAG